MAGGRREAAAIRQRSTAIRRRSAAGVATRAQDSEAGAGIHVRPARADGAAEVAAGAGAAVDSVEEGFVDKS